METDESDLPEPEPREPESREPESREPKPREPARHDAEIDRAARDGAERIARLRRTAQRVDTNPALLGAARRFRHRLPGDERFGDPLSTAGRTPVQVVARGVSALLLLEGCVGDRPRHGVVLLHRR